MEHPPISYFGDKYNYRQADGSYNNVMFPRLGAANTEYARSVHPGIIQPGALPDPALIFDSVFARKTFTPHPNKVSSVFFYWASLIIHGWSWLLLRYLGDMLIQLSSNRPVSD